MEKFLLKDLVNAGKYEEVAAYYEDSRCWDEFSNWDCYYCLKSLNKLGRDEDVIKLYEYFKDKMEDPGFMVHKYALNYYNWAVYRTVLKNYDFDRNSAEDFKAAVDAAFARSAPDDVIFRFRMMDLIVKAITDKKISDAPDMNLVNGYLDMVNPMSISEEARNVTSDDGATHESVSDRERWFTLKTKTLFALGEFDECVKYCDIALNSITRFHNHNDKWFTFRKAKAKYQIGDFNSAEEMIKPVIDSGIKNWAINSLLMNLAIIKGDTEEVLKQAGIIFLSDRDHSKQVNVLDDFAAFLADNGREEQAFLHRRLSVLERERNGWPVKECELDARVPEKIASMSADEIGRKLVPTWREWKNIGKTFFTGSVSRILPSGSDGFIQADDGNSYHFNFRNAYIKPEKIREGLRVRFTLVDMLDKRRNEMRPNAVDIEAI